MFVGTLTPDLYVGYFRELRGVAWGPSGPDPVEIAKVMARYATELA